MALVECLIQRAGPTVIHIKGQRYDFAPIPNPLRPSGEPSTSYCEVSSQVHLDQMLRSPSEFRLFDQSKVIPWAPDRKFEGYAIAKHFDGKNEGYRVENRNSKPMQFSGADGVWRTELKGLSAFDSEYAAFLWLGEELKYQEESRKADAALKADEARIAAEAEAQREEQRSATTFTYAPDTAAGDVERSIQERKKPGRPARSEA